MEIVAGKAIITAMLNEAALHQRTSIAVSATLMDLDLMGADLKAGSIEWLVSAGDYDRAYSDSVARLGDPGLVREVPPYSDLREALQASLLLPPDNLPELMAEVRGIEERRRRPSRYPKQSCLALDTNLIYRRLFSRLGLAPETCGAHEFDPSKVQLLLAGLVEREIAEKVGHKYSAADLDQLKRAFPGQRLVGSMANCVTKDGRKALNAQAELAALRVRYGVWDVGGGEWSEDKERRDGEILRSLAKHAQEERLDVLFVSADDKATAAARSARVPILVLRYPNEVPRTLPYDPWFFAELLHDLAVLYGAITVKGLGMRVLGDWAGKTAEDFKAERVKVVAEESSALGSELARDSRILQRLRDEADLSSMR